MWLWRWLTIQEVRTIRQWHELHVTWAGKEEKHQAAIADRQKLSWGYILFAVFVLAFGVLVTALLTLLGQPSAVLVIVVAAVLAGIFLLAAWL